jgi:hypothetical protein
MTRTGFARTSFRIFGRAIPGVVLCMQLLMPLISRAATATFADEFETLSLHRTWAPGDKWAFAASDSSGGRGGPNWNEAGNQWWVNPLNFNTQIKGLYSASSGHLRLGLLPTPPANQSYIDRQAGKHMPFVGALLNNQKTAYQLFGYYQIAVAVQRVPGFTFQADIESVPAEMVWPPEIDFIVYTDAKNVQWLNFSIAQAKEIAGPSFTTSSNNGFDATAQHTYAWNWQSDYITFYIDGVQAFQTPTPQSSHYTRHRAFMYLLTGANNHSGVDPRPASLPAYAHVDFVRIYRDKSTAAPAVTLTANPARIPIGTSATLTWSSTNAVSCGAADFATSDSVRGAVKVSPTTVTNYAISCTGPGGTAVKSTTVEVD